MKTRTGFVSNSSSSSFLISKPSGDVRVFVPSETQSLPVTKIVTNVKELLEVFEMDYWGDWRSDPEVVERYIDATVKLGEGETLFYIIVDTWDEGGQFFLDDDVMEMNNITIVSRGFV